MQQWSRAVLFFPLFVLLPWLKNGGEILEVVLYTICAPKQSQNAVSQAPGWISKLLLFILKLIFTGCRSLRPLLPTQQLGGIKALASFPPIPLQLDQVSTRCWEHQSVKERNSSAQDKEFKLFTTFCSLMFITPPNKICLYLQYLVVTELMKTQAAFQGWQYRMRATSALFC